LTVDVDVFCLFGICVCSPIFESPQRLDPRKLYIIEHDFMNN